MAQLTKPNIGLDTGLAPNRRQPLMMVYFTDTYMSHSVSSSQWESNIGAENGQVSNCWQAVCNLTKLGRLAQKINHLH